MFPWSLLDISYKLELLDLENNSIAAGVRSAESSWNIFLAFFAAVPGTDVPGEVPVLQVGVVAVSTLKQDFIAHVVQSVCVRRRLLPFFFFFLWIRSFSSPW